MKSKSAKFILLVPFFLIIFVLIGALFIYKNRKDAEIRDYFVHQDILAAQSSLFFEEYLAYRSKTLFHISSELSKADDADAVKDALIKYFILARDEILESAAFWNTSGQVEICTDPSLIGRRYDNPDIWEWMKDPLHRGEVFITHLKRSDIEQIPEMMEREDGITILLVTPFYRKDATSDEKLAGALVCSLSLEKIIDRYLNALLQNRYLRMWIIDKNGQLLYHSHHPEIAHSNSMLTEKSCSGCHRDFILPEKAMLGMQGHGLATMKDGSEKLTSYHPVRFKDNFLSIAIATPYEIVIAELRKSTLLISTLSVLLILIILVVATSLYKINKRRMHAEEEARHIKEKLALEKDLRESEERYRNMIESSNDAIWILDCQGKVQSVNSRFEEITGYRKKELAGKDLSTILLRESAEAYEKAIFNAMKGIPEMVEVNVLHKYLKPLVLSVNVSAVISSGSIIGTANFGRDVTLKRIFEKELIKRNKELSALHEIASATNRSLDSQILSRQLLDIIINSMNADSGAVFLKERGSEHFLKPVCASGVDDEEEFIRSLKGFKIGEGLIGTVALIEEPLSVEDVSEETKLTRPELLREDFKGFAGAPVKLKGELIGVITLLYRKPFRLPEKDMQFLAILASEMGLALGNALLLDETVKKSERIQAIADIDRATLSSLHTEDILSRIVSKIRRAIPCTRASLCRYDREKRQFTVAAVHCDKETKIGLGKTIGFGENTLSEVVTRGKHVYIEELTGNGTLTGNELFSESIRSILCVPLRIKNDIIGTLNFGSDQIRGFTHEDIATAEDLANHLSIAISNAALFESTLRSKREWQNTFDSISDPIFIHDLNRMVIKVNRAFAKKLDVSPPDLIGRRCNEFFSSSLHDAICPDPVSLHPDKPRIFEVEIEKFSGTYEVATIPLIDDELKATGVIHICRDITESKRLKEELIQSEKLSALGQLVSGVAHELNNPLTGVMGYAQLLVTKEDNEQHKTYAEKILRESERAAKIVQNLLAFARKTKAVKAPANINNIIEKTVELRAYNLRTNNIQIVKNLNSGIPPIVVNEQQMQQVFLNILINAEQAMADRQKSGTITISSEILNGSERRRVKIEFMDEGPGVPEQFLSRIFDPFFTTKEVGKGTGLGLSISLGLVKDHGGTISAKNHQNGAIFSIELPVVEETDTRDSSSMTAPQKG